MPKLNYQTTKDILIPKLIVDQVIGQEHAVNIIKKAALKRRNVLLIGSPGTGKSLIGQALAELLPQEKLTDIIAIPNYSDENIPLIKIVPKGQGKQIVNRAKLQSMGSLRNQNLILIIFIIIASALPYYFYYKKIFPFDSPIIYAASMLTSVVFIIGFILFINLNRKTIKLGEQTYIPKLLIDNSEVKKAPFLDATGAHAGALLGDVLHDPLQSFYSSNNISVVQTLNKNKIKLQKTDFTIVNQLLEKYKNNLIKQDSYEAVFLNKNELNILAEKENNVTEVDVLSVNKYYKEGELIKLTTESRKELIVTPEHKVAVKGLFNKIKYIRADSIKYYHKLVTI